MARREAVGKVGLIDSPDPTWSKLLVAGLGRTEGKSLPASTGGVAGGLFGRNDSVVGIDLASIVAVAVVVGKNDVLVESTGLLPAEGPDPEVAPGTAVAESVDLGTAVKHQAELQRSLLEHDGPVGGNTRQILPDDDRQSADCRTPCQANMVGLLDDAGCCENPAEYLGAAAENPEGLGRLEFCLMNVAAGTQGLTCLSFSLSLEDPGRRGCGCRGCETFDLDQPTPTH
jgi:hypothetical protein